LYVYLNFLNRSTEYRSKPVSWTRGFNRSVIEACGQSRISSETRRPKQLSSAFR